MIRRPPRSTRTDTLFPYTTLFRSCARLGRLRLRVTRTKTSISVMPDLVPASNPPQAVALEGRWTPEQVRRSEEHTSELQSLMRISYAVFCLKKKITESM